MNPLDGEEGEKFFVPLNMAEVGGGMEPPKIQGGTLPELQKLVISIVKGEIPPEAGKVMIQAAYPGLEDKDIDAMIKAAEEQEPPEEPKPVMPGQPAAEAEPEAEEPEEKPAERTVDIGGQPHTFKDGVYIAVDLSGVIDDVSERMAKRLAISARKATKKPNDFGNWLNNELETHIPVITDALEPVVKAWRALGHEGQSANEIAAAWAAKWAFNLLEHSGNCTLENMHTYMDGAITELEKTLKQTLVQMIGD
jgi:hypothetical protein